MALARLDSIADATAWLSARGARSLASDSRRVERGGAFIAWPGRTRDAREFVGAALHSGAAACLVEARDVEAFGFDDPRIAALPALEAKTGPIVSAFFGEPSRRLKMIAATGTNGKTSTAWWTAQALTRLGSRCGVIGTLGIGEPDAGIEATGLTTPDPVAFQRALRSFVDRHFAACAIEASSIGLVEHRLTGTRLDVAVFTNFTQDHLDHHGDMATYWQAKRALFDWPGLGAAVVNLDDAQGARLAGELAGGGIDLWTCSMRSEAELLPRPLAGEGGGRSGAFEPHAASPRSDSGLQAGMRTASEGRQTHTGVPPALTPTLSGGERERSPRLQSRAIGYAAAGLRFEVVEGGASALVETALIGDYNVANLLGVIGALRALGHALPEIAGALAQLTPVPGRMQRVPFAGVGPQVVVDYAHTPDALEKALAALQPFAAERGGALVCVFGCGGNRDAGKRPLMGAIAQRLAQRVVLTSDNPRDENPAFILLQIVAGLKGSQERVKVIEDRAKAINEAVRDAADADVILVAGKGHEDYQEVAGVKRPFSDLAHAHAALQARAQRKGAAA